MEVAKHFVGAPLTNKTDDVGVNAGAKEGHGTAGTKAAGGDAKRGDTKLKIEGGRAVSKHGGDMGSGDGVSGVGAKKIEVKRSSGRGVVLTPEMDNAMGQSKDRARKGVTGASMANLFASHCIFLIREDQTGEGGMLNIIESSNSGVENTTANGQFDVAQAEWSTERIRGGRFGIFTRTV
jgi:hypothetical protein